jgi:hypothetical protein
VGAGCGVWGVGFYPFSGGQLPNFQGKSPGIFPPITPMVGTFSGKKSLKALSNKVFIFIQQTLYKGFIPYNPVHCITKTEEPKRLFVTLYAKSTDKMPR